MSRAWAWWLSVLARRETGEPLALFRILSGAAVVYSVLSVATAGIVDLIWIDGGYRPLTGNWLVQFLGGATPGVVWSIITVTAVAGAALAAGVAGRPAALIAGQGLLALRTLNPHTQSAYEPVLINACWLLVLADSTATLSLRCRLEHGRWTDDRLVAAWPRYLVILQLVVLYTATGLHKISIAWTPAGGFSALYFILQQPSWQRGDMTWLARIYPLTQIGTAVTWVWEMTWPLVVFALLRRGRALHIRRLYVGIGLVMHLLVSLLMVVGPFGWVTIAYYPCLFRPGELPAYLRRGYFSSRRANTPS